MPLYLSKTRLPSPMADFTTAELKQVIFFCPWPGGACEKRHGVWEQGFPFAKFLQEKAEEGCLLDWLPREGGEVDRAVTA